MIGHDLLDLDAYEAAYRGHGEEHSVNKLIRALREARAEIARLRAVERDNRGPT